ncbi:MAG TPA: hemerythrin domain-containing protein [Polyangiaceae bacterium]
MNAISLLEKDHRAVEAIFQELEELKGGESPRRKRELCEELVRELSIHTAIEEMIFYPEVKKNVPTAKEIVLESLEEHNVVKWELDALQSMKIGDERLDAKIKVLRDAVMHHVEEEENDLFPRVRDTMQASTLNDMGRRMEQVKKIAPTHPHPRAPNKPPANVVIGMGASVVDRTRDAVRSTLRGKESKEESKDGHRKPKKRASTRTKRTTAHRGHRAHAR